MTGPDQPRLTPLPRRPRHAGPEDARLDDLFESYEPPSRPSPSVRKRPWLIRSGLMAFAASAVVYTAFHIASLAPPYPLILAVCLGAVLVRQAVRRTAESATQRTSDAVRASWSWVGSDAPPVGGSSYDGGGITSRQTSHQDTAGWYEGGDGVADAVRRWERRLEWGSSDPDRFAATVAVRLGELADERLRLRHGITRASDPARARSLLGEQVWVLVHERPGRVPGPREIRAVTDRLETL